MAEIHGALEGGGHGRASSRVATFGSVVARIAVIDVIFSLDSVITAVGLAQHIPIMIAAVVLAIGVMILAASRICDFVDRHPSIKMLALAFLVVVGVVLIAAGFEHEVPKGYVYFAMAFSVGVELLNIRMRKRRSEPVHLHEAYVREDRKT